MNNETAAEILTAFNAHRRTSKDSMPSHTPTEIGQAIDAAIKALKNNLQCRCEAVHLQDKKAKK